MKKLLSLLGACLILVSCSNNLDTLVSDSPSPSVSGSASSSREITSNASISDLKDSAWFTGNTELQFPYDDETLYIKYLPDTLHVTKWISLKENADGTFTAKIEWSETVREIGKTASAAITKKTLNGKINSISVSCDLFESEFSGMSCFDGVTASQFDVNQVPALKSEYLSNWNGTYTLNTKKYSLSVAAKLGMKESDTSYWNANVLNTTIDETTGAYDMLLAHSSSTNGSGSIDPGITGKEPFISKQGLFWTHLTLTPAAGSQWTIKWSSEWSDSPYDSLQKEMDMTDTFTGPSTTKITYKYHFYFGTPKLGTDGFYTVDKGSLIADVSYESDLPTTETWKDILLRAGTVTIPDGKILDYWWYSTNAITGIEGSYVYKLSDSTAPALTEYEFYCALKDKPASSGTELPATGTFITTASDGHTLVLAAGGSFTYDGKSYTCTASKVWQNGTTYTGTAVLLTDDTTTYAAYLLYYFQAATPYFHVRPPKEYTGTLPDGSDWTIMNSQIKNFYKQ